MFSYLVAWLWCQCVVPSQSSYFMVPENSMHCCPPRSQPARRCRMFCSSAALRQGGRLFQRQKRGLTHHIERIHTGVVPSAQTLELPTGHDVKETLICCVTPPRPSLGERPTGAIRASAVICEASWIPASSSRRRLGRDDKKWRLISASFSSSSIARHSRHTTLTSK